MRHLIRVLLILAVLPAASAAGEPPRPREGAQHAVPLYGTFMHGFDAPPDNPFAPGHRGVDVGAPRGTPVRASAAGTVTFAGTIVGNRSVTVDHGDGLRTTYSFLGTIDVAAGHVVSRGDVVGTVGDGHAANDPPHVHLAARRGDVYFDPLELYVGDDISDLLSLVE
jgi:murein DD-endopeptidase MepM/ murein hydrolase activator NlpD